MASLYLVRIDEANRGNLTTVGKKMPLLNLEEVRDFLYEYATAWQQLPPPPVEFIEAEFGRQRAEREAEGRQMPGTRGCILKLKPYPNSAITHLISIKEMSGTIAEGLSLEPQGGLVKRVCRVCGCTDEQCQRCVDKTGEPCRWVAVDLCSVCEPLAQAREQARISLLECEIDGQRLVELTAVLPPLVLAGIGRLEDLSAQDATLSTVFVHESLRRRGIGTQLVRAATAWAAEHGLDLYLHVHPDNPARQLYLAEGFGDCDAPPTDEGNQWLVKWAPGREREEGTDG